MTTPPLDPNATVVPPAEGAVNPPANPAEMPPEPVETPDPMDALPEWAREKLTKANAEAANYRVRLREAETKLADAKTPEDIAAAVAEFQSKNAELESQLLRSEVATNHKLPKELADALKGSTKEELEAHALVLAKYVPATTPPPPANLGGGLNPDDDGQAFDPVAESRKARVTKY